MIKKGGFNNVNYWVQKLLPACNNDIQLTKRQLAWLKEKVVLSSGGDPSKSIQNLTIKEQTQLETYIKQRTEEHKPLQYILGDQPFCELDIITKPPTLIPRWETEEWVYKLIDVFQSSLKVQNFTKPIKILEPCTGSGCISFALAKHLPKNTIEITAIDVAPTAIALAKANLDKHRHQLKNKVEIFHQDLFDSRLEKIMADHHIIVSNPPYITHDEYKSLEPDVKDWEDRIALVTEEEGTLIHKRLIELANYRARLDANLPSICMEIGGSHQVPILKDFMGENGLQEVVVWKDLADKDRVILGF